jgi:hypothetical protein
MATRPVPRTSPTGMRPHRADLRRRRMGMTGLSFAAVPLYDMFCKATGFGGTPMIGTPAPGQILDRTMAVRFDANVAPGLGWTFEPESPEISLRVGETRRCSTRSPIAPAAPRPASRPTTSRRRRARPISSRSSASASPSIRCSRARAGSAGRVLHRPRDRRKSRPRRRQCDDPVLHLFPSKAGQPVAEGKGEPGQEVTLKSDLANL